MPPLVATPSIKGDIGGLATHFFGSPSLCGGGRHEVPLPRGVRSAGGRGEIASLFKGGGR